MPSIVGGGQRSGADDITPFRRSSIVLEPPETVLSRPPWELVRQADRIGRTVRAGGVLNVSETSSNVLQLPGPCWTLRPVLLNPLKVLTDEDPGAIRAARLSLSAVWEERPYWQVPNLAGISAGAALSSSANGALVKRAAAGAAVGTELTYSPILKPKPVTGAERLPLQRIAHGKDVFPGNAGFRLAFMAPNSMLLGPADICTFYWGGPADVRLATGERADPNDRWYGHFALHLTTSGHATLYEEAAGGGPFNGWALRMEFRFANQVLPGSLYVIDILPVGPNRIAFLTAGSDAVAAAAHMVGLPHSPLPADGGATLYEESPLVTGVSGRQSMTGPGVVMLDVRADLAGPFWLFAHTYPEQDGEGYNGYLVDDPFEVAGGPLEDTELIDAQPEAFFFGGGTSIATELYDAESNDPLAIDATTSKFQAVTGQNRYYAKYKLQAASGGYLAPVLYATRYLVDGSTQNLAGTSTTGGIIEEFTLTGPDVDPSHEGGEIRLQDPSNELETLRTRARVPVILETQWDFADPTKKARLFQGEFARAVAKKMGRPRNEGFTGTGAAVNWPSPNWHDYRGELVGMWARLEEAVLTTPLWLGADPDEPTDPLTRAHPPYRITKAVRKLLMAAGFEEAQLDIPDEGELRFGPSARPEDLQVQCREGIIPAAVRYLCEAYLGRVLVWDANAKGPEAASDGMWRLLRNPADTDAPVCSFLVAEDYPEGVLPWHQASQPEGSTFIIDGTYEEWPEAPEFNHLIVTGIGQFIPGNRGPTRLTQTFINPRSHDFPGKPPADAGDIDYLPRIVTATYYDPLLTTPELIRIVGLNLMHFAGHGRKWFRFDAPLILLEDANDDYQVRPRPLRINDPVTVRGDAAVIRSCNPHALSDRLQLATYEGVYF